jgi:hypothetical protein
VVEAPRRLSSRHKEAGMDAAIEAARAGLTFIAVERQRRGEEGGGVARSNDRRWWMFSMCRFLGRGRGDRAD